MLGRLAAVGHHFLRKIGIPKRWTPILGEKGFLMFLTFSVLRDDEEVRAVVVLLKRNGLDPTNQVP